MAAALEKLARENEIDGHYAKGTLLRSGARIARWLGVPEFFSVSANDTKIEEIKLEREWQRQTEKLAYLFAKELGFTREQYIGSLPKFEPQPENWKGRFDIPVIVETRISLSKMLEKAGINFHFNVNAIKDRAEDEFKTPNTPYIAWLSLNAERVKLGKSAAIVRKGSKSDERGGTVREGILLFLRNPDILEVTYLYFPGSRVVSGNAPCLNRWVGLPELHQDFYNHGGPNSGSVVAGKLCNLDFGFLDLLVP